MNKTSAVIGVVLAAGLAMGATSAMAAQATGSVNVRSGPGTSYGVVDQLYRGETVDVRECRTNGWCYVIHSGPDGWVSRNYLSGIGAPSAPPRPSVNFNLQFGNGGFSFGNVPYYPGRPGFPGRPPVGGPGDNQDLVCLARFGNAAEAAAGADADVISARVLTRRQAEQIDRPNDAYGIFDYGSNAETRQTCEYLDRLN
jgi:hypothetical protein